MSSLIAGVGNVFFGDDGFGVELARRLAQAPPANAKVVDFGIRGVHLAFELLAPHDLVVIVDCMTCGQAPGTLYVLAPDDGDAPAVDDAHGMHLPAVFASARAMGGRLPPIRIVGCEPASIEPHVGLSAAVEHAIPAAIELVRGVITQEQT